MTRSDGWDSSRSHAPPPTAYWPEHLYRIATDESQVNIKEVKQMKITDFVRGRTFGVRGNVRKAIVIKREYTTIWWAWSSSVGAVGCDNVADVLAACCWLGPIDHDLLKIVEENGCVGRGDQP